MISEREKAILSVLLNNDEALSIKEISKHTKIKERTLYREIKNLEIFVNKNGLTLHKEKSKYKLLGDTTLLDKSIFDSSFTEQAYSQETRLNLILCFLILNKHTSIKEISESLMLSYNTVSATLTTVENILTDYKLSLLRKKGSGISLEGEEVDKRILLISILCNEISDDVFFNKLDTKDNYSTNPFLKFLNIDFLKELFTKNKSLEVFNLYTDSSIKKILISLNVSILRNDINFDLHENYSDNEYNYVVHLVEASENIVDIKFSEATKIFIIKILKTCRLIEQLSYLNDKYSYTLIFKVNQLIKNISSIMNVDFTQDTNLASGLIAHIESAIKRYQLNLKEENDELLDFVLKNYNELYLSIKSELLIVFDEIKFSSTEVSYIVIHFASSYEQIYRKNFIRALVVCSSGIGSSKILGSQIRKNIPEIKNLEYTIPTKLTPALLENYDVVISTIKLSSDVDYILLPTILNNDDIDLIRKKIFESRSFKRTELNIVEKNNDTKKELSACKKIVKRTKFTNVTQSNIENILTTSIENSSLTSQTRNIVDKLISRHNKSSVVIPKTKIALFHTLDNNIDEPFIIINFLDKDIRLKSPLEHMEDVSILIVMVSPNNSVFTNLLGQISIALLNDEIFKEALFSRNKNFILSRSELIMKNYILDDIQ